MTILVLFLFFWLVGAVYWFRIFEKWSAPYRETPLDANVTLLFNIAISVLWFIYVPYNSRKTGGRL
jgi:hypothetical protein